MYISLSSEVSATPRRITNLNSRDRTGAFASIRNDKRQARERLFVVLISRFAQVLHTFERVVCLGGYRVVGSGDGLWGCTADGAFMLMFFTCKYISFPLQGWHKKRTSYHLARRSKLYRSRALARPLFLCSSKQESAIAGEHFSLLASSSLSSKNSNHSDLMAIFFFLPDGRLDILIRTENNANCVWISCAMNVWNQGYLFIL